MNRNLNRSPQNPRVPHRQPVRKFILCIDRFDALGGRVWAVRRNRRWATARRVDVRVPVTTVFKGRFARQPKAYLTGYCRRLTFDRASDTLTVA